jgi:hypothetical protein
MIDHPMNIFGAAWHRTAAGVATGATARAAGATTKALDGASISEIRIRSDRIYIMQGCFSTNSAIAEDPPMFLHLAHSSHTGELERV